MIKKNRIIALPAYLGGKFEPSGIKWIASYPKNIHKKMDRASAVLVLNSMVTGRPYTLIEGSLISAKRTAASAALCAKVLHSKKPSEMLGIIGCGLINFEILKFIKSIWPALRDLYLYDIVVERAHFFKDKCTGIWDQEYILIASEYQEVFKESSLVSLATTAVEPYITESSIIKNCSVVLNISLRDIAPQIIVDCKNIVDDVEHVFCSNTSVHLAEKLVGNRSFTSGTLSDVLRGKIHMHKEQPIIFNPFGLGVLDIALGRYVHNCCIKQNMGMKVKGFFSHSSYNSLL